MFVGIFHNDPRRSTPLRYRRKLTISEDFYALNSHTDFGYRRCTVSLHFELLRWGSSISSRSAAGVARAGRGLTPDAEFRGEPPACRPPALLSLLCSCIASGGGHRRSRGALQASERVFPLWLFLLAPRSLAPRESLADRLQVTPTQVSFSPPSEAQSPCTWLGV